jgi:hypothetical protein
MLHSIILFQKRVLAVQQLYIFNPLAIIRAVSFTLATLGYRISSIQFKRFGISSGEISDGRRVASVTPSSIAIEAPEKPDGENG